MTSAVINFKKLEKVSAPFKYITVPEKVFLGDTFKIKIFASQQHSLVSPEKKISIKRLATVNNSISEVIELSGSNDVSADFPIAEKISIVAANNIIDKTSKSIIYTRGQPIPNDVISVVNQKLSINKDKSLYGSIKFVYKTFLAQIWSHSAYAEKNKALLFATNEVTQEVEDVLIDILELDDAKEDDPSETEDEKEDEESVSLLIEDAGLDKPYLSLSSVYAKFRVYPASANAKVRTSAGRSVRVGKKTGTIKHEKISFNGESASARFHIDALINTDTGLFYDLDGRVVNPQIHLDKGILKASQEVFGIVFIDYKTGYVDYEYYAKVSNNEIEIGSVAAFAKRQAVGYDIPKHESGDENTETVVTVSFKICADKTGEFEYPPLYPEDGSYPSYDNLYDDSDLVDTKKSSTHSIEVAWVVYNGRVLRDHQDTQRTLKPFNGRQNIDRVYEVSVSYPENADSRLIGQIDDYADLMREKWQ